METGHTPSKLIGERVTLRFCFGEVLDPTDTVTEYTVGVAVVYGEDTAPNDILYNAPVWNSTTQVLSQQVQDGTAGVGYKVVGHVRTSGGEVFEIEHNLAILPSPALEPQPADGGFPPYIPVVPPMPDYYTGDPISHQYSASGGTSPYSFSHSGGFSATEPVPNAPLNSLGGAQGTAGAVGRYDFIITATDANGDRGHLIEQVNILQLPSLVPVFLAGLPGGGDSVAVSTYPGVWSSSAGAIPGTPAILFVAANYGKCVAATTNGQALYFSADRGVTWTLATDQTPASRQWRNLIFTLGLFIMVGVGTGVDAGKSYIAISYDEGDHWTYSQLTGIVGAACISYGNGIYVLGCDGTGSGIFTATDPTGVWTNQSAVTGFAAAHYNGTNWLIVGDNAKTYLSTNNGDSWTHRSTIGTGSFNFNLLVGQDGYFITGADEQFGIYKTEDYGLTWDNVFNGGTDQACGVIGTVEDINITVDVILVGDLNTVRFSEDAGVTWASHPTTNNGAYALAVMLIEDV